MRASSPARADSSRTGTPAVAGSSRTARSSPNPSRPGIITSDTTRSGGSVRAAFRAARPSATAVTAYRSPKRRRTYSRMSALSSAKRTRGRPSAARAVPFSVSMGFGSGSHRRASSTKAAAPPPVTDRGAARTWSGARWAVSRGTLTVNVLPVPHTLSARTSPPWSRTSSRTRASPMPDPSWVRPRAPSTRWNRSKRCGTWSAGMPVPVSRTPSSTRGPARRRATSMRPARVNLKALDRRLRTTFSHISRSTNTGSPTGGQSTASASPARSHAERKLLARSAVRTARSVGSNAARARPASVREKSSRVLTSFWSRSPLR